MARTDPECKAEYMETGIPPKQMLWVVGLGFLVLLMAL